MIVFLLSHVPNPRMNKRITAARAADTVALICVRRKDANLWEPGHADMDNHILDMDMPNMRHPIKRLRSSGAFRRYAQKLLRGYAPACIYTEGLDCLSIAEAYRRRHPGTRIVYEAADLREAFTAERPSLMMRLIRVWEKRLLKGADLLTLTSTQFYERHYKALVPPEKMLFLPNMPDLSAFAGYQKKQGGPFTVGFIGGIRYVPQLKMLVDAAERCGAQVRFAGGGFSGAEYQEICAYCEGKPFVTMTGRYDYDREIAGIYGEVDCVYAVYDADNPNVRLALPNKLYEAVYCGLPIIVAKGTHLAEQVEAWGVGAAVSHKDGAELTALLQRLSGEPDYYDSIAQKCLALKPEMSGEAGIAALTARLKELCEAR